MAADGRPGRKGRSILDVVESAARAMVAVEERDLERLRLEADVLRLRREQDDRRAVDALAQVLARRRAAGRRQEKRVGRYEAIADVPAAYARAVDELCARGTRLSRTSIGAEMGVDRSTVSRYVERHRLPPPEEIDCAARRANIAR